MRKLVFIVIAVISYWIAGRYRQMPLMILAVMEWILFMFLFFLSRCLRSDLEVSFPLQSDEAERGSSRSCLVQIGRSGKASLKKVSLKKTPLKKAPLKKVCIELRVYDDRGSLVQKMKKKQSIDALTGTMDFEICFAHCGVWRVQIYKVYVFDYLSIFSAAKNIQEEMKFVVLPRAGKLQMQPISTASTTALLREYSDRSDIRYVGNDNNEIRQVREYRTGDAMRHIHWNQSARTGKLWYKEFEREEEDSCEILLDMTIPQKWQSEQRDGFYEVLSAVLSELLRSGYRVIISWYDEKTAGFVGAAVEDNADYHSMMRKLYQSEFVGKADAVERAYTEKKTSARHKMYRWNLCLEWYEIKDSGKEELRHRFTYEKLEQELSGDTIFSLW